MAEIIAFEGIDGSGKGTQAARVQEMLLLEGYSARLVTFPQYNGLAGRKIREYLKGTYGHLHPLGAAALYAADRFDHRHLLRDPKADFILIDRYVYSNVAHQCARLQSQDREDLERWILALEFGTYGLPEPDLTVYLKAPVSVCVERAKKRGRSDIHEDDITHLTTAAFVYDMLSFRYAGWVQVDAGNPEAEVQEELREAIWNRFNLWDDDEDGDDEDGWDVG